MDRNDGTRLLPEAPGGRASRICAAISFGWAVALSALFPLTMEVPSEALEPWEGALQAAFLLSILGTLGFAVSCAILARKARARVKEHPGSFRAPGAAGSVMVGLAMLVFFAAVIGIPALRGGHRPHHKTSAAQLGEFVGNLPANLEVLRRDGVAEEALAAKLSEQLRREGAQARNPYDPSSPAFVGEIKVMEGAERPDLEGDAQARAVRRGLVVLSIRLPGHSSPGCVAGAVRVRAPGEPERILAKSLEFD